MVQDLSFNGLLVGAALATFGLPGNGAWNLAWIIATILFSAMTTVLMKTIGTWFVTHFKVPLLTLPFNIATLLFLSLVLFLAQPFFNLGASAPPLPPSGETLNWFRIAASLPIGFGQVFLADKFLAGLLVFLAVALCTPIGAAVGLLGCILGIVAALIVGVAPEKLYAGLWGYNAVLSAMAIGGVFYAPTLRSILIGAACAFLSAIAGGVIGLIFAPLGLPTLTVPFCIVTIGFFLVLQRSLPSLVPVALHTITSPEEHWQRYLTAKTIITHFRRQLKSAMLGKSCKFLFEEAAESIKGNLRYVFDAIDTDRNGTLSIQELAVHLRQASQAWSKDELAYLFKCMDVDRSGEIDFHEFGELMLRHRRLMAKYDDFVTYFLPIDANEDNQISVDEMNVALSSVGEVSLSADEFEFLHQRTDGQPLTWHRFIEMLLVT
jgi:urea transporter/Ca2+-binding EF-hand superfamily protein